MGFFCFFFALLLRIKEACKTLVVDDREIMQEAHPHLYDLKIKSKIKMNSVTELKNGMI